MKPYENLSAKVPKVSKHQHLNSADGLPRRTLNKPISRNRASKSFIYGNRTKSNRAKSIIDMKIINSNPQFDHIF